MNFRFSFPEMFMVFDELIVLVLLGLAVVFIARALRGRGSGRTASPPPLPNEEETLRRLCDQLDKMERRLDNLETILMEDKKRR